MDVGGIAVDTASSNSPMMENVSGIIGHPQSSQFSQAGSRGLFEFDTDPEFCAPDHLTSYFQAVLRDHQREFFRDALWVGNFQ
jgi:hypothetical protein